jgi:hypothetical protein
MAFIPMRLKPESGANRIKSADDAYSFMMYMRLSDRNKPHWQVARQALNHASASDAGEMQAWRTFRAAAEMRRRAAVEPVIGHLKEEHRMGRNYLAHRKGDLNNAVLAAVGYNFRRLIRWLRILLRLFLAMLFAPPNTRAA